MSSAGRGELYHGLRSWERMWEQLLPAVVKSIVDSDGLWIAVSPFCGAVMREDDVCHTRSVVGGSGAGVSLPNAHISRAAGINCWDIWCSNGEAGCRALCFSTLSAQGVK